MSFAFLLAVLLMQAFISNTDGQSFAAGKTDRGKLHGGIIIETEGVKAAVIRVSDAGQGVGAEVIYRSAMNAALVRSERGRFAAESIKAAGQAVRDLYTQMRQQYQVGIAVGTTAFADEINRAAGGEADNKKFALSAGMLSERFIKAALKKELERKPGLAHRKKVYLKGAIIWAMAVLLRPEDRQPFIPITVDDINIFHQRAVSNPQGLLNPNLSRIRNDQMRAEAERDLEAVRSAFTPKRLIAGAEILKTIALDAGLPRRPFADWFRQTVGPRAGVNWQLNECGDQPSLYLAQGRDLPACAEVNALFPDGRKVVVMIEVGTFNKGIAGRPSFYHAVIEQQGELYRVRRLSDLPEGLRGPARLAVKNPIRLAPLDSPLFSLARGGDGDKPPIGFSEDENAPPPPTAKPVAKPPPPQETQNVSETVLLGNVITKV